MTRGMLMGEDDVIKMQAYSKTVKVKSPTAKCYVIEASNYIQRVKIFGQ